MGDFNWGSTGTRNTDVRYSSATTTKGTAAQRFRGSATTLTRVHAFVSSSSMPAGGLMQIEVVDALTPTISNSVYYPGTDVTTAGWTRSTGAGLWAAHVDDNNDATDYLATTSVGPLEFRGAAAALSGKRINAVFVYCYWYANTTTAQIRPLLNLAGTRYYGTTQSGPTGIAGTSFTYTWSLNPSTNLPWTQAEANLLVQGAGTDEFGIDVVSTGGGTVTVFSTYLIVGNCTENRKGFYYGPPVLGWNRYTLSSTSALSANTWYYVVVGGINGGAVTAPAVSVEAAKLVHAASASTATGEHRTAVTLLTSTSGVGSSTQPINAFGSLVTHIPVLLDAAGAIHSQSSPYAGLNDTAIYSGAPAAQIGQEVTATAAVAYAGVRLPIGWQSSLRPDAPLIIKLRTGSFTGTVRATATVPVTTDASPVAGFTDTVALFDAAYTPGAVQTFVTFESSASSGRGWRIPVIDQRTDILTTTTSAEVQGAGFNGTTDAAAPASSTRDTRYDIPVTLFASPTGPATLLATPLSAA